MRWQLALLFTGAIATVWWVRDHPFFWDTVQLGSKHAHYFYETNFSSWLLPESIDSGHPPAFGAYLALTWKAFGKNLLVSHFAMLPFLLGLAYFLLKTGEKIAGPANAIWFPLLCLCDPVLASQCLLISPDVLLCLFFLMALNAIWREQPWFLAAAVTGLGLVSMRGMMLGLGLFLYAVLRSEKQGLRSICRKLWPFVPGGMLALAYLAFHKLETGWVGYHEHSTWAPSFERVDLQGFIRNIAVLGWRLADLGRVFVWLFLMAMVILNRRHIRDWLSRRSAEHEWLLLFSLVSLALIPSQLFYKGLLAHRYLLPVFLSLNMLVFAILFAKEKIASPGRQKLAVGLLCLGLLSGNCWVYPRKISMGWDSTLAHLPWYSLVAEAQVYLREQGIPLASVGTAFPNIGPRKYYDPADDREGFSEKQLAADCYILYSNVMNDFRDEEIDELEQGWTKLKTMKRGGVELVIYKNPKQQVCEN
ncbi:MAG: hypothetical protein RI973_1573 [Bacteroidota bacterium]|jgi:hypothetical protein